MLRLSEVKLPLDHTASDLSAAIAEKLLMTEDKLLAFTVFKRSYDARKKGNILLIYQVDVELSAGDEAAVLEKFAAQPWLRPTPDSAYQFVANAEADFPTADQQRPIIIGFGPCGLLAALLLAQMGLKPIVVERGEAVRQRTKDTWELWRKGKLNTESNVQFGEGGAGTFSDGKLYSQVKDKRHLGRKVLDEFVKAGAPEEILTLSKPHIGTFKLVTMVETMRAEIIGLGGEIRFGARVETLHREASDTEGMDGSTGGGQVTAVTLNNGETLHSRHVILAVGHSARDSFEMLLAQGVYIEAKPFSIGFRIEHPQSVIDKARFGEQAGHPILGAADYKLVHHCASGRSVYSFCMCPGGTVVAATSEEGRVVTNGMSQYSRNERNANAAIVVGITPEQDYPGDVLAGIDLQRELESLAYQLGGANYCAPAQLVGDFLQNKTSTQLGSVEPSYQPGVSLGDLSKALPDFAIAAIREAIPAFDKKIKGFAMADAVLTGVETRTSSPICIRRGKDFQSVNTLGLYPAGEGAGYAGGILSAAIDGIKVAEALALDLLK
ncbi:MAG: NAD(P)/FAD-dependent oxidoreductase [Gammaproteobacteria bacterium]|nr:NAD(P)/FAD-dependent oxidoreductase [Gammaproteobacteria bacterium]MBQ0840566.1 NAD(P)/FAD-dependent oxidoreductase [Gammaproteobacteria bacterium]